MVKCIAPIKVICEHKQNDNKKVKCSKNCTKKECCFAAEEE